jgi:hypothetical protein
MTMLEYVIPQLPYIVPMPLVYLVGVVLSLLQLKRLGTPAMFALLGCGILFVSTAVFPFVQGYVASQLFRLSEMGLWIGVIGLVRVLLQATGFSLVLAAVFTGRKVPAWPAYGLDEVPEAGFRKG